MECLNTAKNIHAPWLAQWTFIGRAFSARGLPRPDVRCCQNHHRPVHSCLKLKAWGSRSTQLLTPGKASGFFGRRLGNCSLHCSRPLIPDAVYLVHPWTRASCIHAVVKD